MYQTWTPLPLTDAAAMRRPCRSIKSMLSVGTMFGMWAVTMKWLGRGARGDVVDFELTHPLVPLKLRFRHMLRNPDQGIGINVSQQKYKEMLSLTVHLSLLILPINGDCIDKSLPSAQRGRS